jgi:hypothetical protein
MFLSFAQRHPILAYIATVTVMFVALVLCLAIPAYATEGNPQNPVVQCEGERVTPQPVQCLQPNRRVEV